MWAACFTLLSLDVLDVCFSVLIVLVSVYNYFLLVLFYDLWVLGVLGLRHDSLVVCYIGCYCDFMFVGFGVLCYILAAVCCCLWVGGGCVFALFVLICIVYSWLSGFAFGVCVWF